MQLASRTRSSRTRSSKPLVALALLVLLRPCLASAQCEELDAELVLHESDEGPFAVLIEQPEGWHSLSQSPGRHIDFSTDPSQFRSSFVFRFNALGPLGADAVTLMIDTESATAIDLEDGLQVLVAEPTIPGYPGLKAVVPTADDTGRAHLVNAAVVSSPDECEERAVELLRRIAEGLRPRPAG